MKKFLKCLAMISALLIVLSSVPLSALAATATDALIAQFSYEGGTAGADINGDMTAGYGMSLGYATLHASLDGENARKLEWTSDTYTHGDTAMVEPIMAAGNNNPWAVGAYIELRLSTKGYTNIVFSAKLGGTKKGPRDFQLQYSLDGVNFTDVAGASYSITTNKVMEQAFDAVALPAAAGNADMLYIRMTNTSEVLINGSSALSGATGGETAVNDVVITGSGVKEGLVLVNAMNITASVFINDDESGLHRDYERWLEKLAPEKPYSQYDHNGFEDNADAHLKRTIMGREVVCAITKGKLDFGTWEQIFYYELDGMRNKHALIKIIGE